MSIIFSFEEGIPKNLTAKNPRELSISDTHFKYGKCSLKWDFKKDSQIIIKEHLGYKPFVEGSSNQARDSFAIWIYNEKPVEAALTFQFGSEEKVNCSFNFGLNFKGWRTAWVAYERDMEGCPVATMDKLSILAPKEVEEGTVFLDQIVLSTPIDPRHATRDYQVPFVNVGADKKANNHWLSLYLYSTLKPKNQDPIEEVEEKTFQEITKRVEKYLLKKQVISEECMATVLQKFETYHIVKNGAHSTGESVDVRYYFDMYPKEIRPQMKLKLQGKDFKEVAEFLLDLAQKYNSTEHMPYKKQLSAIFMTLIEHLEDQGWSYGSSLGTMHHLGYCIRDYYSALFLMRGALKESGLLYRAQKTMGWYSGIGRIFVNTMEDREMNMDILNTTIHGMLFSILMIEDRAEKNRCLYNFTQWLSVGLLPAPGIIGPFKVDGAVFHHDNHYPAYAEGGLLGVCPVVYFLSGTPFRLKEESHKILKKVVLMMRIYCNKYEWLKSLSSRRITGKWELHVDPFRYLALAGTPDGKEKIDKEMAAAFLRLKGSSEEFDVMPEADPSGHWTLNHANLALHRREDWLVGARGHSRYLWANESYVDSNLYGRYISHGHLQILSQGNPINNVDSGFSHEGWDFNRWPGTTTLHLPVEKLRSDVRNVDTFSGFEEMLLSDETFAGGLSIEGQNGMFAMKLHEHPKYEGSHRARKSVFFFDNRIICLGSAIENTNCEYNTETTLFQHHLKDPSELIWINGAEAKEFGFTHKKEVGEEMYLLDNKENGYYIPKGYALSVSKCTQNSKHHENDADTKGDFTSAWIEHGKAPKGESYEYAILVKTNSKQIKAFYDKMGSVETAAYEVLQKDRDAHIVKDKETNSIGYALFEAKGNINKGFIKEVDTPVMVMTKEAEENLIVSLCDPDLRLYSGIEKDQYDENGNRKEVSVYSRKWRKAESQKSFVTLTIVGQWKLSTLAENCTIISSNQEQTTLQFTCQHALPIEVVLTKNLK